jgi:NAD(P)-dependent dehydrogenase (short-subunit alcohol dehydrogenase family)
MAMTWFITGTSSGLGRELTAALLARGDRVAATARNVGVLAELKAEHPDLLWVATLDVTDTAAVRRIMDQAFHDLGRIDVIVSNAGYGLFGAGEELTDDQIRHQIDTNLIGSIQVIRAALPHLRAQGGGRILQLSSEGGQTAFPNFSLYHATKWGIEGFVEAVAKEVAPFGIQFTIVEPGPTATGFSASKVSPPAMAAYAETPAGAMRRALSFTIKGDSAKVVQAMIDSVDQNASRKRLTLGSDAFARVRQSLVERLAELDAQKEIAFSTDKDL